MSDTRSFIPLNIQKRLAELSGDNFTKALGPTAPLSSSPDLISDWVNGECCQPVTLLAGVHSEYNVPTGRASGNQLFRRYKDGTLNLEAARDVVMDAIIKLKEEVQPLTDLEKITLTVVFPDVFSYMDPVVAHKMAMHHLNLSQEERVLIAAKVAVQMNQTMASLISGTGVSSS